jgi:hypothetical protein
VQDVPTELPTSVLSLSFSLNSDSKGKVEDKLTQFKTKNGTIERYF